MEGLDPRTIETLRPGLPFEADPARYAKMLREAK